MRKKPITGVKNPVIIMVRVVKVVRQARWGSRKGPQQEGHRMSRTKRNKGETVEKMFRKKGMLMIVSVFKATVEGPIRTRQITGTGSETFILSCFFHAYRG
jgi:hypothetical protein